MKKLKTLFDPTPNMKIASRTLLFYLLWSTYFTIADTRRKLTMKRTSSSVVCGGVCSLSIFGIGLTAMVFLFFFN
jgi:hypothetical protein